MSDVIISITNRIVQSPNGAYCDELISAQQLARLTSGCSRFLRALDPKLRLCVELIKIIPWKAWGRECGWYYKYDVKVVLTVPNVQKFECEFQFGTHVGGRERPLSEAFFLGVMESVQDTLADYQRNLRARVNLVQELLPEKITAK
ncbi:MAG: hypothetical protein JWM39_396 [Parcubacteria group bacterium]|nr:hypothetical protein [Parcubacteria group bacterium]